MILLDYLAEMAPARTNELLPEEEEEVSGIRAVMRRHLTLPKESARQAAGTSFEDVYILLALYKYTEFIIVASF